MKKLTPVTKSPEDNIEEAIKGRHDKLKNEDGSEYVNPIKKTLKDEKSTLTSLFKGYDGLTVPCRLEQLVPAYADAGIRQNLHDAYSRESKQMKELWDEVAMDADGVAILCPYCHHTIVTDLDHYVPRKEMPEYSVFLHNLIPLCHQCNLDKHDGWKDKAGKRVFFNAYYDDVPGLDEYLDVSVSISTDTGEPRVKLTLKAIAAADSESLRLAKSTIKELHLVRTYWQPMANKEMRTLNRQLTSAYKTAFNKRNVSRSDFWEEQKEAMQDEINSMTDEDFITKAVYEKVITSAEFEKWMLYG